MSIDANATSLSTPFGGAEVNEDSLLLTLIPLLRTELSGVGLVVYRHLTPTGRKLKSN
jgi:hypothetical protein